MGKVTAVCISDRRGIQKTNVQRGYFSSDWGIDGDAHAEHWHRQVSLLSAEKIAAFNALGAGVKPGAFGENLVVEGFDFRTLPVGTLLRCGEVLLEMTQIGKECQQPLRDLQENGRLHHAQGGRVRARAGAWRDPRRR